MVKLEMFQLKLWLNYPEGAMKGENDDDEEEDIVALGILVILNPIDEEDLEEEEDIVLTILVALKLIGEDLEEEEKKPNQTQKRTKIATRNQKRKKEEINPLCIKIS